MRIPNCPLRWLTNAQRGLAVATVGITSAWLCVNECSDKTWERVLIVGTMVSAIAQTYLTAFEQEPLADSCEDAIRTGTEESLIHSDFEFDESHWEQITADAPLPNLYLPRIICTTALTLVGPVLGVSFKIRELCVLDQDADFKTNWLQTGIKVAIGLAFLEGCIKVRRAYRVRTLLMEKEVEILSLPPNEGPDKRQYLGRIYHRIARIPLNRLGLVQACMKAWQQ